MASSNSNPEIRQLERGLQGLLNKQLVQICLANNMKSGGVKAQLQSRIKNELIKQYTTDPARFRAIQATIQNVIRGGVPSHTPQPSMPGPSTNGSSSLVHNGHDGHNRFAAGKPAYTPPAYTFHGASHMSHNNNGNTSSGNSAYPRNGHYPPREFRFKESPFYSVEWRIGDIRTCDVAMAQHRNTIHLPIRASDYPSMTVLAHEKSYRVMLFCAADNNGVQEIAFPHQSECKVNGGEIKANLRGLKGKPGTTRPVDITDSLRIKPANYMNNIEFTYALTDKVKKHGLPTAVSKFYLAAYLCKVVTVDELVTKIGKKIPKTEVVRELSKKANDPDVVATSTVLSLQCPLSCTRLRTPCRSTHCNHVQCFDASSYLQLQEQGPQWICPICNKSAPFNDLAIDEYVKDILRNTDSVEQVTIEPDGQWTTQAAEAAPRKSRASTTKASVDIDDDVSVVTDNNYGIGTFGGTPHAYNTPARTFMGGETPSSSSREPSSAPRSTGKKRAAEVIDLTLSSDEDDAPILAICGAVKKQNESPSDTTPESTATDDGQR
ncbi:hypothetical protein F4777DRAFT_574499 [Nemania sp. FL0916]|nr:hypothetical protein F4777DRAFT_574499 [Nemania sp. FL0916]